MTASKSAAAKKQPAKAASLTLLVDDNRIFLDALARSLKRRGYQVETATGINEAIELAQCRHFRQAVVDMNINGISGLPLVSQLRGLNGDMRITVLTGYASIATAVEAMRFGATNYLSKPADVDDIVATFDHGSVEEAPPPLPQKPPSVRQVEWEHIQRILLEHDGNISAAARALGMHRRTLQRKLRKHTPW